MATSNEGACPCQTARTHGAGISCQDLPSTTNREVHAASLAYANIATAVTKAPNQWIGGAYIRIAARTESVIRASRLRLDSCEPGGNRPKQVSM
jgi:hypothetical protein